MRSHAMGVDMHGVTPADMEEAVSAARAMARTMAKHAKKRGLSDAGAYILLLSAATASLALTFTTLDIDAATATAEVENMARGMLPDVMAMLVRGAK